MGLLALLPVGRWPLWAGCAAFVALSGFAGLQTLRLAETRTTLANARTALANEQRDRADERARLQQSAREQAEHYRAVEHDWQEAQHENEVVARRSRDLAA